MLKGSQKLFHNPVLKNTTAHSYFLNVYPELSKFCIENNLSEKLLKGVESITDEQFSASNKPNELAFYKSVYNIAVENLAQIHFDNMNRLVDTDHILLAEITQFPIAVPGEPEPTRLQIVNDRTLIYMHESQTIKLFKSNDPTFVDNMPTVTAAQRTARIAYFTQLSNNLPPNVCTQFRTDNAVIPITDVERHRARDTPNLILTYQTKRAYVKKEATALAIHEFGEIDPTLSADLQIEWIKTRLTASQKQTASDSFQKSKSLFEVSNKNNMEHNEKVVAAVHLVFPDLKSFPAAYEHFMKSHFEKIVPELNMYFCRLANPQMDSFHGAYKALAYDPTMSAINTVRLMKNILAAIQLIKTFASTSSGTLPANWNLEGITDDVVDITDAQWIAKYPNVTRIKPIDDVYVDLIKVFGSVPRFSVALQLHYTQFPAPDIVQRLPSKVIEILIKNETAYGIGDNSLPKGNAKNNGPSLLANAASVASVSSGGLIKHDPSDFKANIAGKINTIVPRNGHTFKQMINDTKICYAHNTDTHSSKDCRLIQNTELSPSQHYPDLLVRVDSGLPVYFKQKRHNANDNNPAPSKDQKLNGVKGSSKGPGKANTGKTNGNAKDNANGSGKGSGSGKGNGGGRSNGNNGGRGRGNGKNNVQANNVELADCYHCVKARTEGGTTAVPDSESLKHLPSDCPRQASTFALSIANGVALALAPILKKP